MFEWFKMLPSGLEAPAEIIKEGFKKNDDESSD